MSRRLTPRQVRVVAGSVALLALGVLVAWVVLGAGRDGADGRDRALREACGYLALPRTADSLARARRAFRRARGGPWSDRFPYFGLLITDRLDDARRGKLPHEPAIAALAKGDLEEAARRFLQRGGEMARHGARLVNCLSNRGGHSDGSQPQDR